MRKRAIYMLYLLSPFCSSNIQVRSQVKMSDFILLLPSLLQHYKMSLSIWFIYLWSITTVFKICHFLLAEMYRKPHDLSVLQLALVHLCTCYIWPTIFYVHIKTIKKVPLFLQSRNNQLQGIGTRKVNYATWFLLMLTSDWDRIEWERTAYFAQQTKNNQDSRYRLNHSIMGTEPLS